MRHIQLPFIILLLFMSFFESLLGQQSEPDLYIGTFQNEESQLLLSVEKLPDLTFKGELIFQGDSYPWSGGFRLLGSMNATYSYNGNDIGFSLGHEGAQFYFSSEGVTLPMAKLSDKPSAKPANQSAASTPRPLSGQPLSKTAPPASGARYADTYGAYSFQVTPAWKAQPGSGEFIFTNGTDVQLKVSNHNYNTLAAIEAEAKDASDAASQTALKASTRPFSDNGILVTFTGTASGSPVVIEMLHLISPHGGGVVISAYGPPAQYSEQMTTTLVSVANSVTFTRPQVSTVAQEWQVKLAGKQLLYFYTASGYSEQKTIHLCTNGTFSTSGDASYTSSDFQSQSSGAVAGGSGGTWKIAARGAIPVLQLYHSRGNVTEYTLSSRAAGNEVGLDGDRWFVKTAEGCP